MGVPRQSKITPARLERLLEAVAEGQFMGVASRLAGVHPSTVERWVVRANAELDRVRALDGDYDEPELVIADWMDELDPEIKDKDLYKRDNPMWSWPPPEPFGLVEWLYVLFAQMLEHAKSRAEQSAVKNIRRAAAAGNWQADAWYLERTRAERYGRKTTLEHSGVEGGAPIGVEGTVTVNSSTVDSLMARVVELAEQETKR